MVEERVLPLDTMMRVADMGDAMWAEEGKDGVVDVEAMRTVRCPLYWIWNVGMTIRSRVVWVLHEVEGVREVDSLPDKEEVDKSLRPVVEEEVLHCILWVPFVTAPAPIHLFAHQRNVIHIMN